MLVATAVVFSNFGKFINICEHFVYGPQAQSDQKNVELNLMDCSLIGHDIDATDDNDNDYPPHGTFYTDNLRISSSFIAEVEGSAS